SLQYYRPMHIESKRDWIAALDTAVSIPTVPFRDGGVDFAGHQKNIEYLLANNALDEGRLRIICLAGTSLIHHMSYDDQVRLMDETGRLCDDRALLIAGLMPNPNAAAAELVERQTRLPRPPDAYLIMPLAGNANPPGIYDTFMAFGERCARLGARFL